MVPPLLLGGLGFVLLIIAVWFLPNWINSATGIDLGPIQGESLVVQWFSDNIFVLGAIVGLLLILYMVGRGEK